MTAYIKKDTFLNLDSYSFGSVNYQAIIVPGLGANLISLKHKNGADVFKTPKSMEEFKASPYVFGIPILFPPNRIPKGKFTFDGRNYFLPVNENGYHHLHGFLHDVRWDVADTFESDAHAKIVLVYKSTVNSPFYNYFPHIFEAKLSYMITDDGLYQEMTVTNLGAATMPYALGFHTAINTPFMPNGGPCVMRLSAAEEWELDKVMMPTEKRLPLNKKDALYRTSGRPVCEDAFDNHYNAGEITVDGKPFHGAIITDTKTNYSVVYKVDEKYKHWMCYNNDGKSKFVCPEPQTCAVNCFNLSHPDGNAIGLEKYESITTQTSFHVVSNMK